jgi:hypothetical protein
VRLFEGGGHRVAVLGGGAQSGAWSDDCVVDRNGLAASGAPSGLIERCLGGGVTEIRDGPVGA